MNQFHVQPCGAEEVIHKQHHPITSVSSPDDLKNEASWPGWQNHCGCRGDNPGYLCTGDAQTEDVCTVCEQPWEPTLQNQGQDPHLGLANPGLPQ